MIRRILLAVLPSALALMAQALPSYDVYRTPSPIVIDAKLDEPAWEEAPPVGDFHGAKEQTVGKMLWDDENLYVSYYCHDKHISAYVTERQGPVSRDDCVEIFVSPNPGKVMNYYTFEINAIGAMLNRCRTDWWKGPPTWEPEGVRYRTTYHGLPKKDESPDDDHWIVELAIPLRNFAHDAAHTPPQDGDQWRLNLNRTGGITDKANSTWSPLPPEVKTFHTPQAFGWVRFVNRYPPRPTAALAQNRMPGRDRRGAAQGRTNPLGNSPETVVAGREIYNRTCTVCHGLNGAVGDRAPGLAAGRRFLRTTDQDLFDAIRNGISGTLMPASALPETDIWKVTAYIRSLRATASDTPVDGDVAQGEQIFRGKGRCADCHMLRGRGGFLGPDLTNIAAERSLSYLRDALTKPRANKVRGYRAVRLTTAQGQELTGILKNENNFSLQFLDAQGQLHLLDRADLRSVVYESQSLMPGNYGQVLSPAEMQSLMAFLSRQVRRRPASGRLVGEEAWEE